MLGMHGTYEANLAMHHCDVIWRSVGVSRPVTGSYGVLAQLEENPHRHRSRRQINKTCASTCRSSAMSGCPEALLARWKQKKPKLTRTRTSSGGPDRPVGRRDCLRYERTDKVIKPQYASSASTP